jgi:hypothetical protein
VTTKNDKWEERVAAVWERAPSMEGDDLVREIRRARRPTLAAGWPRLVRATMRKKLLLLGALIAVPPAVAEVVRVPVPPTSWAVSFDAPALKKLDDDAGTRNLLYSGNAGRLNVTLHVGPPECPGGSTNQEMYDCFSARLKRLKGVVPESVTATETPRGIELTYLLRIRQGERSIGLFNMHLLFAHRGSWGDLHVSMVQPQSGDMPVVTRIIRSFAIAAQ